MFTIDSNARWSAFHVPWECLFICKPCSPSQAQRCPPLLAILLRGPNSRQIGMSSPAQDFVLLSVPVPDEQFASLQICIGRQTNVVVQHFFLDLIMRLLWDEIPGGEASQLARFLVCDFHDVACWIISDIINIELCEHCNRIWG